MIVFYSDPHLGLTRTANTTPASALALQDALFKQALSVVDRDALLVCGGDLFDKFSNPEYVQRQAMFILDNTSLVIAGNHDVTNQADKIGSLQLLDHIYEDLTGVKRGLITPFGESSVIRRTFVEDNATVDCIPHVATQELFEQALQQAAALSQRENVTSMVRVLLLHCNYQLPEEWQSETTLNLTKETALRLLKSYDYVLLGHEHAPAEHLDGRLIIIGNTHPTGMADISDKRVVCFEDGRMRFEKIWDAGTGYQEFDCGNLPDSTEASFIRITGEIQAGGMLDLTRSIARMWKNSERLYCVKMDAKLPGIEAVDSAPVLGLSRLPATISEELKNHPARLELWNRLVAEETEN